MPHSKRMFWIASLTAVPISASILQNGDFEKGAAVWNGLSASHIAAAGGYCGNSVHLTNGAMFTQSVPVTPGKTYVLMCRFKWVDFTISGSDWGYWMMEATDIVSVNYRNHSFPRNVWNKTAMSFVAKENRVEIRFGVFGPASAVDLWFDDFQLIEKTVNKPPVISPTCTGAPAIVPATVQFQAHGDDSDGAIATYHWNFGDGTSDDSENPAHAYLTGGVYRVMLTVYDNDNATASSLLTVGLSDTGNPAVTISSPSTDTFAVTGEATAALSGSAQGRNGKPVLSVVWDNVSTGEAGRVTITPAASVSWTTGAIPLKPGRNVFMITATDAGGKTATGMITVTRTTGGPSIRAVTASAASVELYSNYQVTFDLQTIADNTFFGYDENPPMGIAPKRGVTVEGEIRTPSGRTLRHPAFWYRDVIRDGAVYIQQATEHWALRFSPQETGTYSVSLYAKDASGEITVPAGVFTATKGTKKGFVRVSRSDGRYFEYSNGDLFWPTGPAWASDDTACGLNFDRPWMGGRGAYSANWARWMSSAEKHGNEGVGSHFSFREHFKGHELSQHLHAPEGYRMWMGWMDEEFRAQFTQGTTYRVIVRCKVTDLAGPKTPGRPYGLVIKVIDEWPNDDFENHYKDTPSILPVIAQNRDWHTVVASYARTASARAPHLFLYLDNVTAGNAYIDYFSIREDRGNGAFGGELVRNPSADLHTYVEQRPAAYFDQQLSQGERNGRYYRYVVMDKNDFVPNHLLSNGLFAPKGDGYYQKDGTKAKWLLQQWWRYLCARYGYSTSVHSWELNNEGPPDDGGGSHARMTQEFAKFMHDNDAHRHLASTSFWSSWRPSFWGDTAKFPDVDYADIHHYTNGVAEGYDIVRWHTDEGDTVYKDNIGKPVIRNETGISGGNTAPEKAYLTKPNDGTWWHNLLWSQLHVSGMSDPGYWFQEHFANIGVSAIVKPWSKFINGLDLNKGGYVAVAARSSNASLRILGQKHPLGKAAFWIQNTTHDWPQVLGVGNQGTVVSQSGTVTVNLNPNLPCKVDWYDTYAGTVTGTQNLHADAGGDLTLTVTDLTKDVAVLINHELQIPAEGKIPPARPLAPFIGRAFPNPFRNTVLVPFSLGAKAMVEFTIYGADGTIVRTAERNIFPGGAHAVRWDGRNETGTPAAAGVYLARLRFDGKIMQRKLVVLR